ncbi:MAG: hypothetical protein Q9213_001900 [Squamulea squamosa]
MAIYQESPNTRKDLVASWHEHRYLLFVLTGLVIVAIRAWRRSRIPREQRPISPLRQTLKKESCLAAEPSVLDCVDVPDEKAPKTNRGPSFSSPISTLPKRITSEFRSAPKRVAGSKIAKKRTDPELTTPGIQPLIFFFSLTGTTEKYTSLFAKSFLSSIEHQDRVLPALTYDLSYIDYDDYFVTPPRVSDPSKPLRYFYLFLLPTYNIDTVLNTFLTHLEETHHDFRVDTAPLSSLAGYSIFGFGDREGWQTERAGFCSQALEADKWMARLTSRKRAYPVGMGDVKSDVHERLAEWADGVGSVVREIACHGGLGEGVPGSGNALESDEEADSMDEAANASDASNRRPKQRRMRPVDDLEDIKGRPQASSHEVPVPIDFTTSKATNTALQEPKEMVPKTSPTYAALTKQGYAMYCYTLLCLTEDAG